MIRPWLAERVLDYLAYATFRRGKYRLAQLAAIALDGVVVRSAYGPLLHSRFADSTFWLAARYGNDEVMALLEDLGPHDGFVDVGANIGLTTCFASSRGAAVLSFEPSAREYAELLRNIGLLESSPPVALRAAASHQAAFLSFRVGHISHSGGNSPGVARDHREKDVIVPAVKLDDVLMADHLLGWAAMYNAYTSHSLVVKIDVEGFEGSVLQGMERLLRERRCRKVIVELNVERAKTLGTTLDINAYMISLGYDLTVTPAGRSHFDQCFVPR